ncbi:MAG: ABC transporter ATP-binding protein [Chloroflexota bacterium]
MTHRTDIHAVTWPADRLDEALTALAYQSGLTSSLTVTDTPTTLSPHTDEAMLNRWVEASVASLHCESEAIATVYPEIKSVVQRAAPAILYLSNDEEITYLAVLRGGRKTVQILDSTLRLQALPVDAICDALRSPLEAPLTEEMDRLLNDVGITEQRREKARKIILAERLSATRLRVGWLLRPQPGRNLAWQVRQARLPRYVFAFIGSYVLQYGIWLLAWWVIGRGALQGRLDFGLLTAWGLLLVSLIPFKVLSTWSQGQVAIKAGVILKRRLLAGILCLSPEEIRHQGAGQFLGQVIEAEAVESLALTGGLLGLVASLELIIAALILWTGSGGLFHLALLVGWLIITGWLCWRFYQRRQTWTGSRLSLTHALLERMVGHRTRLAQENPAEWHRGEDQMLTTYLKHATALDQATVRVLALIPRGWVAIGVLGLLPAFVTGTGSITGLAIGLGGVLLAYQALQKLTPGLQHLVGAIIAWQQVKILFETASRLERIGSPTFAVKSQKQVPDSTLVEAHRLAFRYLPQSDPILRDCHLHIKQGDQLLLEGPSGGGKSTLAMLLTGLRQPDSGLLLLRGLDQQTLGDLGWRQRIIAAPQFHENHVLTGTFAFNLLMGRHWPPRWEDIEAAEDICQELGLGDLLERMPAGLMQMVGETGWQLSHGEKSRMFLARALLQEADLTILDESFAALDPENLERALRCVLKRAKTLLVIAHP